MRQGVLKNSDLNPDGVRVVIDWEKFLVGMSIFIPCINTEKARRQAARICKELGYEVIIKVNISDKKLGVRVWRTV